MAQRTLTGVLMLAMCCLYRGCSGYDSQREGLAPHAAISPDDREILFSWYKNGRASLYVADVNGGNVRRLTSAKRESHIKAVYSHDGSKILFLAYREKRGKPFSNICVMDANGSNLQRLTSGKQHITEAIFAPDGNTIYYLQSNFFGHYSPITGSRPHDFDIYSVNSDGTNSKKLTHLGSYRMYGLSVTPNGRWLAFAYDIFQETDHPFHFLDLKTEKLTSFRPHGQFYSKELITSDFQLSPDSSAAAFVAVAPTPNRLAPNEVGGFKYELYLMDLKSRYSTQITKLRRNIDSPRFMHNWPRLIFIVNATWLLDDTPRYELWAVNTDGTGLSRIDLGIADLK